MQVFDFPVVIFWEFMALFVVFESWYFWIVNLRNWEVQNFSTWFLELNFSVLVFPAVRRSDRIVSTQSSLRRWAFPVAASEAWHRVSLSAAIQWVNSREEEIRWATLEESGFPAWLREVYRVERPCCRESKLGISLLKIRACSNFKHEISE